MFRLDTREVKRELEDVPINRPEVIIHLAKMIRESIRELEPGTRSEEVGPRK